MKKTATNIRFKPYKKDSFDYVIGDLVVNEYGETLVYTENGFQVFGYTPLLDVLKGIREVCRNTKCKECKFYVSGKIVDKCLFDDMPMDWELYKLKEVKQNG